MHKRFAGALIFVLMLSLAVFAQEKPDGNTYIKRILFNTQEFIEFNPQKKQYVLDDRVNIRNNYGINAPVIDQLNTGDEVFVIDNPDEWLKVDTVYAPWYRIQYYKNGIKKSGYICGRYISYKFLEADIDCDTKNELLLMTYAANRKNTLAPWGEEYPDSKTYIYELLYMKDQTLFKIADVLTEEHAMYEKLTVINDQGFNPPVALLSYTHSGGGGGDFGKTQKLFYFTGKRYLYIDEFKSWESETGECKIEIIYPSSENGVTNEITVIEATNTDGVRRTTVRKYLYQNGSFVCK